MLNNKKIRYMLIAIFSALFVFSAVMLIITVTDREKATQDFNDLASLVVIPEEELPTESDTTNSSAPTQTVTPKPNSPAITRNIPLLREMNSECIGWVYIKNTKVNYPVMFTPADPEKYLKRNFYGQRSGSGVPFIDVVDWRNFTEYTGYDKNDEIILNFWDILNEFNQEQLKRLLQFCTGSKGVPIGGFKELISNRDKLSPFTITRV
jgi:hypothetical protein